MEVVKLVLHIFVILEKQVFSLIVQACVLYRQSFLLGLNGHTFTITPIKLPGGQVEEVETLMALQAYRIQSGVLTFKM